MYILLTIHHKFSMGGLLELFVNLTRVFVWSWLFCIWYFPCIVSFSTCLGLVWRFEWRHSISVHWWRNSFWHAKRCHNDIVPQWTILNCSNFHTVAKHAPKTSRTWKGMYAKQPTPNQTLVEIMGTSIV